MKIASDLLSSYRSVKKSARHFHNTRLDRSPKMLVITYHRVVPAAGFDPLGVTVNLDTFRKQILGIARRYPIIPLATAADWSKNGFPRLPRTHAVITFDDGYADNFAYAAEFLNAQSIPATFFVVTDWAGSHRLPWEHLLMSELLQKNAAQRELTIGTQTISQRTAETRRAFALRAFAAAKTAAPWARRELQERLKNGGNHSERLFMTWDELRSLTRFGHEIGSHTQTHQSLPTLPFEEALREIRDSKAAVERHTAKPCRHFAFPFGSHDDYTGELIEAVRAAGYDTCLLNIQGPTRFRQETFCYRRIAMSATTRISSLAG